MRRSSAPSIRDLPSKRKKFSTPFVTEPVREETTNDEGIIEAKQLSSTHHIEENLNHKKINTTTHAESSKIKPFASTVPKRGNLIHRTTNRIPTKSKETREVLSEQTKENLPLKTTDTDNSKDSYYSVVWCKCSNKKHKVWEGDGVIVVKEKSVTLYDATGSILCKGSGYKLSVLSSLEDGCILKIGSKEVEIQGALSKEDFDSGKCFAEKEIDQREEKNIEAAEKSSVKKSHRPTTKSEPTPQKVPTCNFSLNRGKSKKSSGPRHNPNDANALVMPRPNCADQKVIDVVVDPYISSRMRPHQREGVRFLYECVMGYREGLLDKCGAILADEMGLGKTLQCIALVWTLLKQGPFGLPVVKNVIIITPSSLVKNWYKEFIKWLGSERISPFVATTKEHIDEYLSRPKSQVLIISYDMLLRCIDNVQRIAFDLLICDEAHRLKNANIKTTNFISNLNVPKRVLLTGTPIQNNLDELYALCELAIPNVFGSTRQFKKDFTDAIMDGEQPDCTQEQKEYSRSVSSELSDVVSRFCLRRTSEVNQQHLPPRVDYVVFAQMSTFEKQLYKKTIESNIVRSCLVDCENTPKYLECIDVLRKLCNHPLVLFEFLRGKQGGYFSDVLEEYPTDYSSNEDRLLESCKMIVLRNMLYDFKEKKEKVVVVANSTKVLDVIEEVCKSLELVCGRLDGQTPSSTRQNLVEQFNSKYSNIAVFLLSCKAGGVGLNLVGASRLILYDIDWNPAHDNQAMSRIWRDGQKKEVHIYRLITVGTIEEKMYQRQISKQNLSRTILDSVSNKLKFSKEDLQDLFQLYDSDTCCTYELLKRLTRTSTNQTTRDKNVSIGHLMEWEHIKDISCNNQLTEGIRASSNISFIFRSQKN